MSATATLVSTRTSGLLPLSGIAERAHEFVVDLEAGGRDHETTVAFGQGLSPNDRFDAQAAPVCAHLYLTGAKAERISKLLGNHQTPCLVDGCAHA